MTWYIRAKEEDHDDEDHDKDRRELIMYALIAMTSFAAMAGLVAMLKD